MRTIATLAHNTFDLVKGILTGREGGALASGVSRAKAVSFAHTQPTETDVVVIGGGIIGCCTALQLAERGVRVTLCEKGVIGGEASSRALGLVDSQLLAPSKMELIARAKVLWEGINQRVQGDTGYRKTGMLAAIDDPGFMAVAEEWVKNSPGIPGIDARMLDRKDVGNYAPGLAGDYLGALYQSNDASIEPQLATSTIAEGAALAGATILQQTAVIGIETSAGRISSVVTEHGTIRCQSVVVTGGAWSPVLLKKLGIELPQFIAISSIANFGAQITSSLPVFDGQRGIVLRPTLEGTLNACIPLATVPITPQIVANVRRLLPATEFMADQLQPVWNWGTFKHQWCAYQSTNTTAKSPFIKDRILMPATRHGQVAQVHSLVQSAFPTMAMTQVKESWSGILTSTIDNMPYISEIESYPGLFVGSGFYFGITMAPAAGEALADLVTGEPPKCDLSLYRASRFSDGSPIVFRP